MIIAGVCYTTNNRDGHLFNTERTVKAVNGTDQTRRIAGGQLQIILSNSLFIIRIAMEKNIRHGVALTALENSFHTVLFIIVLFVLCTDTARRGVQHDIHVLAEVCKAAGNRNVLFAEGGFIRAVDQIQVVLHAVLTDHTAFAQRLKRKRGDKICDADQLHVFLQRNAIGQALTNCA